MRKRTARRLSHAAVHQPSDVVSVLAIGATAIILVLSLFAMERFAGIPVSVRGAPMYTEPVVNPKPKRTAITRPSLAAKRAAARRASRTIESAAYSSATSGTSSTQCENTACANLISLMLNGDPTCMKEQTCVNSVYQTISQPSCSGYKPCAQLSAIYAFFYVNQGCVTSFTSSCQANVQATINRYR